MPRRQTEIDIARKLCSSKTVERRNAITAFVRLFTFSAPTELALLATCYPDACASYRGDGPLARHLIESLPLPEELSLAWRVALLEGDALAGALRAFHDLYGTRLRALLDRRGRDPEDVWQDMLVRVMTQARFRRTCFGSYASQGSLGAYLRTVLIREAARRDKDRRSAGAEVSDDLPQGREPSPDRPAQRDELRSQIAGVLRELTDDPGLMPFLLQQGLEMTPADVADILSVKENVIRQRTFRFRERFRRLWRRDYPQSADPFSDGPEDPAG